MAAWRGLERGDEVRELRPWLHRIAHNTSLNLLRQSGYDYEELLESLRIADAAEDELERRAVVRQTLQGLAALPARQRDALLAIAVEGRSQDEVASELGLTAGAVRQLVHRARTALRTAALLHQRGPDHDPPREHGHRPGLRERRGGADPRARRELGDAAESGLELLPEPAG